MALPVLICVALSALLVPTAEAANGDLTQKAGRAGCISFNGVDFGIPDVCTTGTALDNAVSIAMSPDARNAYVAVPGGNGVAIFDRDTATGALIQKPGPPGCMTRGGTDADSGSAAIVCTPAELSSPRGIVVSPDGKNVYAASADTGTVAVFDRDSTTGALTQKSGTAGAATGTGLAGVRSVAISPDGRNIYTASWFDRAVTIFDRDLTTGTLTAKPDTAGCISDDGSGGQCRDGRAAPGVSVAVSPDGTSVYGAALSGVSIFDRDPATGALTQKAGPAGCITDDGSDRLGTADVCTDGAAFGPAYSVAVNPGAHSVYVAHADTKTVAIYNRDSTSGALRAKPATKACVSDTGSGGACAVAPVGGAQSLTISADALSAYSVGQGVLASFDLDPITGDLTAKPSPTGCISFSPTAGCQPGRALIGGGATGGAVTVSPDGKNVYTSNYSVALFDRVDDVAPETTITSGVAAGGSTTADMPTFAFNSSEPLSSFECGIDGGAVVACVSPFTTPAMSVGPHTFLVRAIDATGNIDPTPASRAFTVADALPSPMAAPPIAGSPTVTAAPAPRPDTVRPIIRGLKILPPRFKVGARLPALVRSDTATGIRFEVSEPGTIRLTFARRLRGRRAGHRCHVTTPASTRLPRCWRFVTIAPTVAIARAPAGANTIRFEGRLSRTRTLLPGRYRLTITATDTAGNRSQPKRASLTVTARAANSRRR